MIGIYKITSPTGKVYIGQSVNVEKRLADYKSCKAKKQPRLNRSFLKHGYENHKIEIICECSIEELNDKERYYQDLFSCIGENGLNCVLTTSSDRSGYLNEEVKNKLKGKPRPESVRLKISESNKGKKLSKEHRKKISENSRNISEETRQKYRDSHIGNYQSEETKKKISETLKGKPRSEETKLKIASRHGTRVVDISTGQEFLSVAKAARHFGYNIGHLHNRLKGVVKNNTNLKFA